MIFCTLVPGFIFVLLFLIFRIIKGGFAALVLKTSASVFFIFTAIIAVYETGNFKYGLIIISALMMGLIGDIFLDLKWMYPEKDKHYLFSGFISFMVGHILFLINLMIFYDYSLTQIAISIGISLIIVLMIIMGEKPLQLEYGNFLLLNVFYGFILTFVTALSGFVTFEENPMFFVALVMFLISDMILAMTYFGKNKNTAPYIISNHLFYYGAQYLIAVSILFY